MRLHRNPSRWPRMLRVAPWTVMWVLGVATTSAVAQVPCVGGSAGIYTCQNVDLLSRISIAALGGASLVNDIWGWTDPMTGREYALVGRSNGTSFVDVTDPVSPVYLGNLPSTFEDTWRDIKVYADHAFIVQDSGLAINDHGIQVFDLTQLRSVVNPPVTFSMSAWYTGFTTAHNIAIDEESGFAYGIIGGRATSCSGGLHMVDISDPLNPQFVGCHSADGAIHDAQCVVYDGPDTSHVGKQLCFTATATSGTFDIIDVTDKSATLTISKTSYAGEAYIHQGWLTDDHKYFVVGDEFDESDSNHNTRTYVFDISDLELPVLTGSFTGNFRARDHNQYVRGRYVYQANYTIGLRVLELTDLASGTLTEVASFDTRPESNGREFDGAWSVYPFFASCNVIVSDIQRGLLVLRPATKCVCGDGFLDLAVGEECDDGNTIDGDDCSSSCALECDEAMLTTHTRLFAVEDGAGGASFTWEADANAEQYHVNSMATKEELVDPRLSPTGNGGPECTSTPPITDCVDVDAMTESRDLVFYQILSSCGPDGSDEGAF